MTLSVLSWNCRGAKSGPFHRHLQELLRRYTPMVLILLETTVNSGTSFPSIYKYSSFNKAVCAEAVGFVGGIWIIWDATVLDLEVVMVDDQVVTVIVRRGDHLDFVLTAVYASPRYNLRVPLWDYLIRLGAIITEPWVLIGDWNQVLSSEDKFGGRPVSSLSTNSF